MLEIINDSNHAQQCQILIKEGHKVPRKKVKQAQKSHEEVQGGGVLGRVSLTNRMGAFRN